MEQKGYLPRIIDSRISEYLKIFGAVSLEGPKWCGKTWTALNHAKSVVYMHNPENNFAERNFAETDVQLVLRREAPELIDEWQEVPAIWDAVRYECDRSSKKGQYILTGSATPVADKLKHSGAGRICRMKMTTMTLFEARNSENIVSLNDLFSHRLKNQIVKSAKLKDLAYFIVRGGWPANIKTARKYAGVMPSSYIDNILDTDISSIDGVSRNKQKMTLLLRSLARNESGIISNARILKDISETDMNTGEGALSENTLEDYLNTLSKLSLTYDQPSFNINLRSTARLGKSFKRHFVDPSLAAVMLSMTEETLMTDFNTFGFLFEALCEHDLKVYIEDLGGEMYFWRDNKTGMEVDAILELKDGRYGAVEIKLGANKENEAAENLLKYSKKAERKPEFLAVINGNGGAVYQRKDGVYVLPITALGA